MPLKTIPVSAFAPRLSQEITEQQIRTMGYNVLWRKAMVCPNRIETKYNHDLNCTVCDGTGFLYESDDEATTTIALITSISMHQEFMSMGRFDAGMARVTFLPCDKLSWWDKIEMLDSTVRYTEVIVRTDEVTDKFKYKVLSVSKVVDAAGTAYTEVTDFTINDTTGELEWITGQGPAEDVYYSVIYECRPIYIVLDMLHHVRDSNVLKGTGTAERAQFPIQAVCKLDFLIGDESKTT